MTAPEREHSRAEKREAMREQRKRWAQRETRERAEIAREKYLPNLRRMFHVEQGN